MTRSFFTKAAMAATVALVAPTVVSAQNTVLNFTGSAQVRDPNPLPDTNNGTLLIDFLTNAITPGFGVDGTVRAVETTDLIGVVAGTTTGSIRDLTATPAGFAGTPIAPFLTIGGYTFSLNASVAGNTFGPISLFGDAGGTTAVFSISGTVAGPSLNPGSTFTGRFSSSFDGISPADLIASIDNGTNQPANFSARFTIRNASVVPEPSTYALMASGVAMLGAFARRRRQA